METKQVLEYCKDRYKWLFVKQEKWMDGKRRRFRAVQLKPFVEDHDNHWRVYREPNSSPLILSKDV